MLGAVIPRGDQGWFFKVTGGNAIVAQEADKFNQFIASIRFGEGDDDKPQWTLPEGWTQEPGSEMRFATIKINTGEQPLELTVIPLPMPATDGLLANINRWRGQLGLGPVDQAGLAQVSTELPLADGSATLVNLVGKSGAGQPMMPPTLGGGMPDADAARRSAHAAAGVNSPADQTSKLTFEAPPEWQPGELVLSRGGISIRRDAAFIVTAGEQQAEITITALPAAAGAVLPNVNRWRAQIGLEPLTEAELREESKAISLGDSTGEYFRCIGPQQAILGVVANHGGQAWFVKLQGDHDLAIQLQGQFEAFVQSIKF